MRDLPVFITETDQGDVQWQNENTGWVRAAYAEIDAWNRSNTQKIRSLILYRWPQVAGDRWGIEGKANMIADFRAALGQRLRWDVGDDPWTVLRRKVEALEQSAAALAADAVGLPQLATDSQKLKKTATDLAAQAGAQSGLRGQFDALDAEITGLEEQVDAAGAGGGSAGADVSQPELQDRRGKLPTGAARAVSDAQRDGHRAHRGAPYGYTQRHHPRACG